jgi:hypothetical protein
MSTAWGYVCLTHDPELHQGYLAHNTGGRDELAKLWRQRGVLTVDNVDGFTLFGSGSEAAWFLFNHPRCQVVLENEYRDRIDPADLQPLPPKHCPTCTCEAR